MFTAEHGTLERIDPNEVDLSNSCNIKSLLFVRDKA
jgi:hypothetical protein